MKPSLVLLEFILMAALVAQPAWAQTDPAPTPAPTEEASGTDLGQRHVVQPGETLFDIAAQYDTTVEAIQQLNDIADPTLIYVDQELLIPGLGGAAIPLLYTVQVGDSLHTIAAAFNTTSQEIAAENRLLHPDQLIAGQELAVINRTGTRNAQPLSGEPYVVQEADSLASIALQHDLSPQQIAQFNDLPYPYRLVQGQRLRLPGDRPYQDLPANWRFVRLEPMPAAQGKSQSLYVETLEEGEPAGSFSGQPLRFVPYQEGYIAMIGLTAFADTGSQPLTLTGSGERPWPPFHQDVRVEPTDYGSQTITLTGETANLLDPALVEAELELLATLYTEFTPEQLWEGTFQVPVSPTLPTTAGYGIARSYNGGPYSSFHSGTDYAGFVGTAVYAPNAGIVRFAEPVAVRGNIIIIDHGLGVMTGYYHLNEIRVTAGERVNKGQHIGELGTTGLSTGPHLHWDLRVLNAAVDPLQWLADEFP